MPVFFVAMNASRLYVVSKGEYLMKSIFSVGVISLGLLVSACGGPDGAKPSGEAEASQSAKDMIAEIVASPDRSEEHKVRDAGRKPADILAFSKIKPGDKVGDLAAAGGYYTAMLSRLVGDEGAVYSVDPSRIFDHFPNARETFPKYAESDPRDNVSYTVQKFDELAFDEPLDVIMMVLYYHDTVWTGVDRAAMNKALYDALKPGGMLVVVDHNAAEGAGDEVTEDLHRMVRGVVEPEVTAAGFVLDGKSDVLSNPDDDRTISVFDEAVRGSTDRFVYRFKKPE